MSEHSTPVTIHQWTQRGSGFPFLHISFVSVWLHLHSQNCNFFKCLKEKYSTRMEPIMISEILRGTFPQAKYLRRCNSCKVHYTWGRNQLSHSLIFQTVQYLELFSDVNQNWHFTWCLVPPKVTPKIWTRLAEGQLKTGKHKMKRANQKKGISPFNIDSAPFSPVNSETLAFCSDAWLKVSGSCRYLDS